MSCDLVIIGDCHANPDYSNDRFDVLGRALLDLRPECIVQIGDYAEVGALNDHAAPQLIEGKKLKDDFDVTKDALRRMLAPIHRYNSMRARNKKAKYDPQLHITLGNHEDRVSRYIRNNPRMEGLVSLANFGFEEAGLTVHPFKRPFFWRGMGFAHYVPTKRGYAMSGETLAISIAKKQKTSYFVGHNHELRIAESMRADGNRIVTGSVGCYLSADYEEDWSAGSDEEWWSGIIAVYGVRDGGYSEWRQLRMERLQELYG